MTASQPSPMPTLEELLAEFSGLSEWDERYEYLIDLGRQLPELDDSVRTAANTVKGCMSSVWMILEEGQAASGKPVVRIHADSDSLIVKGLIAVLLAIYDGRSPQEILLQDEQKLLALLGLDQNLSPQRRNGLFAMVQRVRQRAVEMASRPDDP